MFPEIVTEWRGVTSLLLQTTTATWLKTIRKRIFSAHELTGLLSNSVWVGLAMKKQVNNVRVSSKTGRNPRYIQLTLAESLRNCTAF